MYEKRTTKEFRVWLSKQKIKIGVLLHYYNFYYINNINWHAIWVEYATIYPWFSNNYLITFYYYLGLRKN